MSTPERTSVSKLMDMLNDAYNPFDEGAVAMDCNDGCEEIAQMAERVAHGERLEDIHPKFAAHLQLIRCSKEEFYALVSIIRAEQDIES